MKTKKIFQAALAAALSLTFASAQAVAAKKEKYTPPIYSADQVKAAIEESIKTTGCDGVQAKVIRVDLVTREDYRKTHDGFMAAAPPKGTSFFSLVGMVKGEESSMWHSIATKVTKASELDGLIGMVTCISDPENIP